MSPMESAPRIISMSREDFNKYRGLPTDSEELSEWMSKQGVSFDTGLVTVSIEEPDGNVLQTEMNTSKKDFGTLKE